MNMPSTEFFMQLARSWFIFGTLQLYTGYTLKYWRNYELRQLFTNHYHNFRHHYQICRWLAWVQLLFVSAHCSLSSPSTVSSRNLSPRTNDFLSQTPPPARHKIILESKLNQKEKLFPLIHLKFIFLTDMNFLNICGMRSPWPIKDLGAECFTWNELHAKGLGSPQGTG